MSTGVTQAVVLIQERQTRFGVLTIGRDAFRLETRARHICKYLSLNSEPQPNAGLFYAVTRLQTRVDACIVETFSSVYLAWERLWSMGAHRTARAQFE